MCSFKNENGVIITYDLVRQAQGPKLFSMSLTGRAIDVVTAAVNRGIDSHLEACFVPDRGDSYKRVERKTKSGVFHTMALACKVSSASLSVLLRRLYELESWSGDEFVDEARSLAGSILQTLGIGEDGKLRATEDDEARDSR